MNSKNIICDEIPEETYEPIKIEKEIGQKTPIIKAKLDDTNPSILNLSQNSNSTSHIKMGSFNIGNLEEFKKDFHHPDKILSLFSNNKNFIPSHMKAYSNEIFSNPKMLNFCGRNKENEKKIGEYFDNDDNSSNYEGELNFNGGFINFAGEKEDSPDDVIKNICVENINNKDIEEEDENEEGYNILHMLKKRNSQSQS